MGCALLPWLAGPGPPPRIGAAFHVAHFALASAVDATNVGQMLRALIEVLGSPIRIPYSGHRRPDWAGLCVCRRSIKRRRTHPWSSFWMDSINWTAGGKDSAWPGCPSYYPGAVRLVISTSAGPVLDELLARGWPVLKLAPLDVTARREFAGAYLWHNHRKKLDAAQLDVIASCERGSNPQFLSDHTRGNAGERARD